MPVALFQVFRHIPSFGPTLHDDVILPGLSVGVLVNGVLTVSPPATRFYESPPPHTVPWRHAAPRPRHDRATPAPCRAMLSPPTPSWVRWLACLSPQPPPLPLPSCPLPSLQTPVQLYFGLPFHRGALAALRHRTLNMNVLVSVGTFAAYGYSIAFLVASIVTQGAQGKDNEQFETAAMLITFILLGRYLEAAAKGRASSAVSKLLVLQPPTALQLASCKEIDGDPMEVPVSGLRRGDVVKVLPGAQVPTDGTGACAATGYLTPTVPFLTSLICSPTSPTSPTIAAH